MSLTGGLIFSNAKQLSDLNGAGVCAGVSFGSGPTGGVTVCGGLTPDAKFSGVVTVFPNFGIGLSEGGGVVGAELLMTWTSTGSFGETPGWILPRFGPGPQRSGPPEGGTIRNSGSDYTGRWDGGSPGGFANAGTPT
jgi:hypothetical protein